MKGWMHLGIWATALAPMGAAMRIVPHPAIAGVIGLLPLGLLVVLYLPQLMVLGFVVFSFFRIHESFPFLYSLKIPLMLSLASISALGWHIFVSQQLKPYWSRELTYWFIFIGLVAIGIPMATNPSLAIESFSARYWKIALMMLAIVWLTRTDKDFATAGLFICLGGCATAGVALFNKVNSIGLVEGTRVTIGRDIGSVLGDPNDLSLVLMLPTAFTIAYALDNRARWYARLFGGLSFLALFSAIIATQSRGGLLGIIAVVGFFWLRKVKSLVVTGVAGVLGLAFLYAVAGISDRASGGAAEEGIDASSMGRLWAWQAAYRMALHNPFTGVGLDNFYSNYYYYSSHWDGKNHSVHSTWFGVLAETGILGLIMFITAVTVTLRSGMGMLKDLDTMPVPNPLLHRASQSVVAGIWGTLVSGTFLTQGFTWPIYILSGLQIALLQVHRNSNR